MMLQGYTINENELIEKLDPDYFGNTYLKNLKMTKQHEFGANCRLYNNKVQDKIIEIVSTMIKDVICNIYNDNFDIRPLYIKNKFLDNIGCKYCEFKDICYYDQNNDNNKNIKKYVKYDEWSKEYGLE